MARKKTDRVKAPAADVPQTREAVVEAIAEIGRKQRERTRIETAMNDEIATIRQAHEAEALPLGEAIGVLALGVQAWCEANRADLTGGVRKTVAMASGEVRWRMTPPKVEVKGVEAVLELLRTRGMERFIRTKEEPNKEAMLLEPEAVKLLPGIKIKQHEEFVIVPHETALEEVS